MSAEWFRSWHGAPHDPKWAVIAKRAKIAPAFVIAVAWELMDRASQSADRGSIEGHDPEAIACIVGAETEQVEAIISAMRDKGVVVGNRFSAWERRQPKREGDNSTERVRKHRERVLVETKRDETHVKRDETPDTDTDTEYLSEANASLVDGAPVDVSSDGTNVVKIGRQPQSTGKAEAVRTVGEWWNSLAAAHGLSQIDAIKPGSSREAHAWARCRELASEHESLSAGLSIFAAKIRGSPFLCGHVGAFRASFDWVVNASNFQKIMEGNYENREAKRR